MSDVNSLGRVARSAALKARLESEERKEMFGRLGREISEEIQDFIVDLSNDIHERNDLPRELSYAWLGLYVPQRSKRPGVLVPSAGWNEYAQQAMVDGILSLSLSTRVSNMLRAAVYTDRLSYYVYGQFYPVEMRESDWKNAAGFLSTTYLTFEEWAADMPNRKWRLRMRIDRFGPKAGQELLAATEPYWSKHDTEPVEV